MSQLRQRHGEEITAYSCEDATEQQTERILLEPIVNNTDGLDKQETNEGMKQEILSMKQQQVYMEVDINTLTPEHSKNIIQSRSVLRDKGNKVRARIDAKGFTETVTDLDDICASTHIFCVENTPDTSMQQRMDWSNRRHLNSIFTCGSSNSGPLHVPAKQFLQSGGQHRMETAESNLRTTEQSKSMAETPGRSPSTDLTHPSTADGWTQHLHDRSTQVLCLGLGRRRNRPSTRSSRL